MAFSGRTVIYQWGGNGGDVQLTKIIDPGNNIWEFKYDIMGNTIEMIYPDGSTIKQGFDMAGRLKNFTNKRNQSIHYSYYQRCQVHYYPFGDVHNGFNYSRMQEIILEFTDLIKRNCIECDARFLCTPCYIHFAKDGKFEMNDDFCRKKKQYINILEKIIQLCEQGVLK